MKKILIVAIIIIGLILIFPTAINWYTEIASPDKTLKVGEQVDKNKITFTKEIKDEEKIIEYENLLKELVFSTKELAIENYPDLSLHLAHKEGYITDVIHLWFEKDEGIIVKPSSGIFLESNNSKQNSAKLTKRQMEKLREIIE